MSRKRLTGLLLLLSTASAQSDPVATAAGQPASPAELAKFFAIQPDGAGLPDGRGSVSEGRDVYAQRCSYCHGEKLEGIHEAAGPALVGGRGSLTSNAPVKTVESYWPEASTLFDYIWRAMPFDAPGSLDANEVYALTAFILAEGGVLKQDATLDAKKLPKIVMPNAKGFYAYSGPDLHYYGLHSKQK